MSPAVDQTPGGSDVSAKRLFVGIELGGTKILCRIVDEDGAVQGDRRFATSTPVQAIADIGAAIDAIAGAGRTIAGIGIASFGPIVVDPAAADYGRVLRTPKPGWTGFDLNAAVRERLGLLGLPIAIDTDVNAAALAEQRLGAGRGLGAVGYVTIGTGIGGGLATRDGILKGSLHPEIGHVRLRRRADDRHPSTCPFHDDCAEGLAAGPAVAQRLSGTRTLADAPEVRALVAGYLGELLATLVLAWSPHRIVVGGGVTSTVGLLAQIDAAMRVSLAGYGPNIPDPFLAPAHFADAGLEGALIMAARSGGCAPLACPHARNVFALGRFAEEQQQVARRVLEPQFFEMSGQRAQ